MPTNAEHAVNVIGLIALLGSGITWVYLLGNWPFFWATPRETPLPSRTVTLVLAGGMLLIGKTLLMLIATPAWTELISGPPSTDPGSFDSARVNLMTQINTVWTLWAIVMGALVILTRSAEDRRHLGFRTDKPVRQCWFGLQGFLLSIVPVGVLLALVNLLQLKEEPETMHPLLRLVSDGYVVWPCLLAIFLAPIQEELVYRVLLQEGLVAAGYPIRAALPAIAVFFSINHMFPDMIPLVPLAILFGAVMHYRVSFLACVVMHMLFNGFNIAMVLLGGAS